MKHALKSWLLLGALAGALPLAAQDADSTSSIKKQAHRRIVFQFDNRYSIIDGKLVGINGLKLAVEWRGRLRAGAGGYLLSNGIPSQEEVPAHYPSGTRSELRFRYVAAYAEYLFIRSNRWELSAPLQLGVGRFFTNFTEPGGAQSKDAKSTVWLMEPSVSSHFRVFPWFGIGVGAGWRETLFVERNLDETLDGPIFYGRVKLFLGDLYKTARFRRKLFSQQHFRYQ
ncbi:hypothetical protein [Hymenobacter cellulosivorans]|uniref:DUF3575 domain-containing protein n=1 Tax=Hymenobacter cellulosivorans TaxID=2932249 RepID=A0ABY4F7K0_9BACT|nr:hypothetical protein [Hymenobacter cellulosivorans]UOQ52545.1 hypothetical protein MUN80_22685 [Hymenobacter cellulosivorans]